MAIFNPVMKIFSEILSIPYFMSSPFLCLGVQDIEQSDIPFVIPDEFKFATFGDLCRTRGMEIDELDPFDYRAKLSLNLNEIIRSERLIEQYATVLDYGCIEHIFDTKTVISNCMRMVKLGGLYAVHTPVRNFAGHGLHTFSPELIGSAMDANGFEVIYERYTTSSGRDVDIKSDENVDVVGWYVGKKISRFSYFTSPEQKRYAPK